MTDAILLPCRQSISGWRQLYSVHLQNSCNSAIATPFSLLTSRQGCSDSAHKLRLLSRANVVQPDSPFEGIHETGVVGSPPNQTQRGTQPPPPHHGNDPAAQPIMHGPGDIGLLRLSMNKRDHL